MNTKDKLFDKYFLNEDQINMFKMIQLTKKILKDLYKKDKNKELIERYEKILKDLEDIKNIMG